MTLRSIFRTAVPIPLLGAALCKARGHQNKFLDSIRLGNHSWRIDFYWELTHYGVKSLNFHITMSVFVTKVSFICTECRKSHFKLKV